VFYGCSPSVRSVCLRSSKNKCNEIEGYREDGLSNSLSVREKSAHGAPSKNKMIAS